MSAGFHVIIPARYGSVRLPGKPLLPVGERPLIQHVYDRCARSSAISVTVATDDTRIADAVAGFGADTCLTSAEHASGTDRIAEACDQLGIDDDVAIVNVQGDEPQVPPSLIDQIGTTLISRPDADIVTACEPFDSDADRALWSIVKVVRDKDGFAMYFSRLPIPWCADGDSDVRGIWRRHIGIYGYRAGYVREFSRSPRCPLEKIERLEQLRALWKGDRVYVADAVAGTGVGIDTLDDYKKICRIFNDVKS